MPHSTRQMWNVAEPLAVEYKQPIHYSSDQSNSGRKKDRKATLQRRDRESEGKVNDGGRRLLP